MIYSYSRLKCFRNCPLSFRFQYVDKVKVEYFESIEAFMGSRVHDVLEHLHLELKKGNLPSFDNLSLIYDRNWNEKLSPDIVINRRGTTAEDYRLEGLECLRCYYDRYKPFDALGETLDTELKVVTDLLGDKRYIFIGYIDRLDKHPGDGAFEIHDYKTSRKVPLQGSGDWDWQLAIYEMGIRQKTGSKDPIDLVWHYLKHDREIRIRKKPEEMQEICTGLLSVLREIEEAIDKMDFPRVESGLCSWCPFQEICREDRIKSSGAGNRKCLKQSSINSFF